MTVELMDRSIEPIDIDIGTYTTDVNLTFVCLSGKFSNCFMGLVARDIYDVIHVNAFKLTSGHVERTNTQEHVQHSYKNNIMIYSSHCSLKCNAYEMIEGECNERVT